MFRTTLDFYGRAYGLAVTQKEKAQILPYLLGATRIRKPIPQMEDAEGNPIPLRKETAEIKKQRKAIESALELKILSLTEAEPIEGMKSMDEIDFRLRQELTHAGWSLTERNGKVVICSYLPTLHEEKAIPA